MKDYNKRVFRKIMTYLLKSKFLIGMTEIKLNHIMRKKIYNVMNTFSRVSGGNVEFVQSAQEPVFDDEDPSIDSDVQEIDLSGFSGMGYIAFKHVGNNASGTTSYILDNILVE